MSIIVKKGTFVKSTSGAPVAQTIDTGSGQDIKFLKLFAVKETAEGFSGQDVSGSHGFSDGTTEKAVGYFSDNITNNKSITSSCSGDKILCFVDGTETITAEADVTFGTGIDAGKFTITWTTNDSDADIIHYEAYTGSSLTDVKVGEFSSDTGTGNQAVTGVGFLGEYISLMSASNTVTTMTQTHARIGFGQAISSSARNAWGFMLRDDQNANKDSDVQLTDACLATLEAGGMDSGQIDGEWDFVSFDADGFTLNVVNAPDNADKIFYAVINGGEYDVGSFNQPTSTGTDTVTVGFRPREISLSSWNKVADTVPAQDTSPIKGSYGSGTASAEGGIWFEHDNKGDGIGQDEDVNTYTDKIIKLATAVSTIDAEADFDSTTATAFVLDWTTADATAREILYFAIGQVAEEFEFLVDAFLQATQTETFLVDAIIVPSPVLFTVDAKLSALKEFDVDTILKATFTETFLVDARLSALKEFTINAILQDTFDEEFLVDAYVQALNQEETFFVDTFTGIPAITVRQGTLIKDTGGAPVSQTIDTGTDVEIKFIKLSSTRQTSEGFEGIDLTISEGFSDGTNSRAISFMSEEGVNTTQTGSRYANKGLTFIDSSLSTIAECDVSFGTGVDAGKFTLTWTTNDSVASIINFVTYGDGSETFSANVGTFTSNTSTGNQSITGVGFQGSMSLFLTNNNSGTAPNTVDDGGMCVGHASSPLRRNTITFLGRDNQDMDNRNNITQRTDLALRTLQPSGMSVGNVDADYDFVSFDADGFTLNVIDAPLTAIKIFYAVLKGGSYRVGEFDQPTSNGTQEIMTGAKPIHTCFRSWNEVADIAIKSAVGEMKYTSSGADEENGTEEGGYWFESDTGGLPVNNDVNTYTDRAILLASGTSTVDAEANYESSNANSFTLDWTVTDATAREILYWTVEEPITKEFTVDARLAVRELFTVDAVIVRNTFFDVDARLSALAEFEVDARLSALAEFDVDSVIVRNALFDVDAVIVRNALFDVDARLVRSEEFEVDARLSALAEFEIDARIAQRELFTVDAVIVRNALFDIDAVIVRNELFDIDAVVVDRFDEDFTVDAFVQATQIFNFTIDGFIEETPEKFFLIDAFIRDTFDEDFTVDSRIAVRELFEIDARLSALAEFTVDARLSALAEFTVDGRLAQRELFEIDAVIVRNKLFDVDARIAVRELFTIDAVIVRNELFNVDARLSALAEFEIDSRLSALAEFTIDGRIAKRELFTVDARLSALDEFTVDARLSALAEFTVDGRIAVRELFTVDAELRPIQEFTVDAFVQTLNQEETFLVDARLKDLNSVLVIVDAFVQELNQEETFIVDAFIEDIFTETFLVDAKIKGEQEETFFVDTLVQDTFDEDFTIDAFVQALNQEETFLIDARLAIIVGEEFLVDGLTQAVQTETFDVDAKLAQRVEKDFTVDAKIAFRETFTVDATLSPRELFTVDAFTKATQTKTFLIDSILTVAGQKIFTVNAFVQDTFDETFTVDSKISISSQEETFFVDSFIQDTFTETFTIDARTEELNSETFDVDAIIKALNTDKTFIVDTFTQETESPKAFTVDSFIQKTQTETTQVDAKVRDVIEETFIIDSFIQDIFTKTFSVDSILTVAGQKVFTIDALTQTSDIDKTFTVEAKIQVVQIRPWQIDAIVTGSQAKTFIVDAQIFLPTLANFTVDGFLVQPVSILEFTVDAKVRDTFTKDFLVDAVTFVFPSQLITVDGLTLGTQTKDFTVSAVIRNVNQETFDIDALIQLTGDVLCSGISGVIFNDDITTDTNWTVTGSQILVDDASFPNVIRMECLQSFFAIGTQQVVKALDSTIINFKAQDLVFDLDHLQIFECTGGFRGNGLIELSETSSITASLEPAPSQAYIRYRIISSGPQPTHFARLEISDGTTSLVSSSFQLTNNQTRFVRISIVNNGSDARIEFFNDSARTSLASSIPDTDISSLTGKSIGFVQVANLGGGGGLRKLRGEFDNLLVTASRLCPEFTVDSVLKGEIEKEFTVDASIVTLNKFTVGAILSGLNQEETFLVDAFIGTPEVTFTIDALLKTQGKFTVDALIEDIFDEDFFVDSFVKALNQEEIFTIDAQIIRAVQYNVDAKLSLQAVEPFTIDGRISVRELFDIDATLRDRFDEQFLIDGSTLGTVEKDFTIDGILIVFPSGVILVDSIIQAQDNDKTFTVDSQLFKADTDFDFTVDAFILRTGEQLCDPSQITSFPDFTEDFSTYTNQTEADTAWVPQDISTAQVDITNDVLGVIQVSDTSNDANIFSNGLSPDSSEWVLRWKLVISSITFTAGGTCEGFFGWSAGGTTGGSSNQKSIGVQMRFGTDIGDSEFRANLSNSINPIFPPQPGGNMNTPPDVGTYYFEMIRTGPLGMDVNIYSDANFTDLIEHITFSLGFFGSTPSGLGYKNNQLTNTGSIDYTIDDIQFWNGISDVSISSCPRFNVDAVIQTPTIDKEFIVDAVIKTLGENGICNFFPGTNLAIDTGLEQFIGPIQPAHEPLVEQLVGQEVTLNNQQVRSITILLRSSNFPNEITTNMPINAEVWSDVVLGNFGGETTEAISTTVIDAINTSGDLPSGDWTEVKFTFDINTTPFLTGDFVVGYRSLSSVVFPAGVGTAIPVVSNSNVIPGSAVHRKGANSILGNLDKWEFLTSDQKDMVIQLEVVNGDEIILGVGKQCPLVDAVLDPSPNKFEIDSIITNRFQRDFTIDTVLFPFPVPFTVDGILVGTILSFTVDAVLVPEPKTFTVDGILTGAGQKVFLIDAVLQPFIEFEIDGLVQALETKSPKFNLNALLVVEDREIDFTVDGSTKFFDQVAPFIVDAQVIFFPSQLPQVDGIIKELGALHPFTVDAFIQQLDFNFIRFIDALLQKSVGKNFLADALIETKDTEEDFTIDARLSTPSAPFLFTVDGLMLLENHRWQTDALLQTTNQTQFSVDLLIVALPQKLFLVDASTLGTINETFIIDGLLQVEAQESFTVDARILQIVDIDYTVDSIIKDFGVVFDFTVDSSLVRIGEFLIDSFIKALGDGIVGTGNNGSTNANNTINPFISQTTDDNTITLPIGTLVGQRLRLPTAPVRVDDYTFVIHRAGTAGTPTGTLTGKIYKNSIGGNSISGADLIATSDNVVSLSSITTSSSGQNIQFTFTNPPEITVDDNVFIGFDIVGSNEQMFLHTESTGTVIDGGDVNIESTGIWGVDLGVDAVLAINIDTEQRQRGSALMHAFVGRFIREIIGVDALIKSIGGESGSDVPAEFTVDAKVAFVKEAGFTVDTQLIGSQDFTVSAFVGDTLFVVLEVESVIVENNSNEGVESVIVENNSDEGVESVIGQD